MSGAQRAAQLRLEESLVQLRELVEQLERRVSALELARSDFELVHSEAGARSESQVPSQVPITSRHRERILLSIGRWLKSALEGNRRGSSGRDLLPEESCVYLVLRGFDGNVFDPVVVTSTYRTIVPLVKQDGNPGDSIFIGLPSVQDAQIVCRSADVAWPGGFADGL